MVGLPQGMTSFAMGSILYIPNIVWLIAIVYMIGHVALQKTTAGRKVCAVGDNSESAKAFRHQCKEVTPGFPLCCLIPAALSGIKSVYLGRLNSEDPSPSQSQSHEMVRASLLPSEAEPASQRRYRKHGGYP